MTRLLRGFRFHLLTMIVGSFVAGGVLYLNSNSEIGTIADPYCKTIAGTCYLPMDFVTRDYGWPERFVKCPEHDARPIVFLWTQFALDLGILFGAVLLASIVFEIVIYKRTGV